MDRDYSSASSGTDTAEETSLILNLDGSSRSYDAPQIKKRRTEPIFSRRAAQRLSPEEKLKLAAKESLNFRLVDNYIFRESLKNGDIKKQHLRKTLGKWMMCVLIGIVIGAVTYGIRQGVRFFTDNRLEITWRFLNGGEYSSIVPLLIFLSFNLVLALAAAVPPVFIQPLSGSSGLPEVKAYLNGIEMPKTFNVVTLLGKIFSLICSFSSGLALGPEGPMVHIATMIAAGLSAGRSKTLKFDLRVFLSFRNAGDKRDFVTIGTAAGMAAAFGAPVGGVLFALEETASYWTRTLALRTFFCCMIATFIVNILLNLNTTHASDYGLLTLSISGVYSYRWAELVSFSLIGITAGLLGPLFVYLNIQLTRYRVKVLHTRRLWKLCEVAGVVFVTTILSFYLPALFPCTDIPIGSSVASALPSPFVSYPHCGENQYNEMASLLFNDPERTIRLLFANMTAPYNASQPPPVSGSSIQNLPFTFPCLALFITVYFGLMTVTAGLSLAGGLFVPNMLLGAAVGRFIGETVEICFPDAGIDSSIYAMIGAAAFVAGSLRLSLSICVIIVELTGMTSYLLPLILVTMIAKWIGDLFTESIYEHLIELKHLPFLKTHPPSSMLSLCLGDVMAHDVVCFRLSEKVETIVNALKMTTHNGFPVVDDKNHLYGLISRDQLLHLLRLKHYSARPNEMPFINYKEFDLLLGAEPPTFDPTAIPFGDEKKYIDLHPYMNTSVVKAYSEDSFVEGYNTFRILGIRHMVIVNKKNVVVGMITRKDLL
eukprot:TRINITY_DN1923_c0_g1_i1.p1 TRINITY_DN1923_c0_g1~~TRINITY_DN1923_c0_g1_i1.p1  ORF type:complete len:768 (-),score=156.17 TRINITY_DN1923_c0_g1_i1:91-2394(-)